METIGNCTEAPISNRNNKTESQTQHLKTLNSEALDPKPEARRISARGQAVGSFDQGIVSRRVHEAEARPRVAFCLYGA